MADNRISKELSNKIANMSFVCACLVVLIHVPGGKTGCLLNDFIYTCVKHGLSMIAVPVFFIISGFFLGRHINERGWYSNAIVSRIRSLVIPFFALNLLWLPIFFVSHYIGVKYFGADNSNHAMDFSVKNILYWIGIFPWGGGCVSGLWYLRALFYLVLLSPIFAYFIRKGKFVSLFMIAVFLSGWCCQAKFLFNGMLFLTQMSCGLCFISPLYFFIGMFLSRYGMNSCPTMYYIVCAIVSVCLFWCCVLRTVSDPAIRTLMTFLTTISLAFALWGIMPVNRWPQLFVKNSFRIYVVHGMILFLLSLLLKACGLWTRVLSWPVIVPIWATTVVVSVVVAELLRRYVPKASAVVFGGR